MMNFSKLMYMFMTAFNTVYYSAQLFLNYILLIMLLQLS